MHGRCWTTYPEFIDEDTLRPCWGVKLHTGDGKPRMQCSDGKPVLYNALNDAKAAAAEIRQRFREFLKGNLQ